MNVLVPISLGELYDKISILEIKKEKFRETEKINNVIKELELLLKISELYPIEEDIYIKLKQLNNQLWQTEDNIRKYEREETFDGDFVRLARKIYYLNDQRSQIKREINLKYNSDIIEEKSYEKYS